MITYSFVLPKQVHIQHTPPFIPSTYHLVATKKPSVEDGLFPFPPLTHFFFSCFLLLSLARDQNNIQTSTFFSSHHFLCLSFGRLMSSFFVSQRNFYDFTM